MIDSSLHFSVILKKKKKKKRFPETLIFELYYQVTLLVLFSEAELQSILFKKVKKKGNSFHLDVSLITTLL